MDGNGNTTGAPLPAEQIIAHLQQSMRHAMDSQKKVGGYPRSHASPAMQAASQFDALTPGGWPANPAADPMQRNLEEGADAGDGADKLPGSSNAGEEVGARAAQGGEAQAETPRAPAVDVAGQVHQQLQQQERPFSKGLGVMSQPGLATTQPTTLDNNPSGPPEAQQDMASPPRAPPLRQQSLNTVLQMQREWMASSPLHGQGRDDPLGSLPLLPSGLSPPPMPHEHMSFSAQLNELSLPGLDEPFSPPAQAITGPLHLHSPLPRNLHDQRQAAGMAGAPMAPAAVRPQTAPGFVATTRELFTKRQTLGMCLKHGACVRGADHTGRCKLAADAVEALRQWEDELVRQSSGPEAQQAQQDRPDHPQGHGPPQGRGATPPTVHRGRTSKANQPTGTEAVPIQPPATCFCGLPWVRRQMEGSARLMLVCPKPVDQGGCGTRIPLPETASPFGVPHLQHDPIERREGSNWDGEGEGEGEGEDLARVIRQRKPSSRLNSYEIYDKAGGKRSDKKRQRSDSGERAEPVSLSPGEELAAAIAEAANAVQAAAEGNPARRFEGRSEDPDANRVPDNPGPLSPGRGDVARATRGPQGRAEKPPLGPNGCWRRADCMKPHGHVGACDSRDTRNLTVGMVTVQTHADIQFGVSPAAEKMLGIGEPLDRHISTVFDAANLVSYAQEQKYRHFIALCIESVLYHTLLLLQAWRPPLPLLPSAAEVPCRLCQSSCPRKRCIDSAARPSLSPL